MLRVQRHIVFARKDSLLAAPFDLERLEVTEPPVPMLERIQGGGAGIAQFSVSQEGTLAYVTGSSASQHGSLLVRVDRQGVEQSLAEMPHATTDPRLSPDGRLLAVTRDADIWTVELARVFYRNGEKMMAVAVSMDPELSLGEPNVLFEGRYRMGEISVTIKLFSFKEKIWVFPTLRNRSTPSLFKLLRALCAVAGVIPTSFAICLPFHSAPVMHKNLNTLTFAPLSKMLSNGFVILINLACYLFRSLNKSGLPDWWGRI